MSPEGVFTCMQVFATADQRRIAELEAEVARLREALAKAKAALGGLS
jgi:hypothetical protein